MVLDDEQYRYGGIYRGICHDNNDPQGLNRVKVKIPSLFGSSVSDWAPRVVASASLPNPGDGVWIVFEAEDPSLPVWVGSF